MRVPKSGNRRRYVYRSPKIREEKAAALARAKGSYTFEQRLDGKIQQTRDLALSVRSFLKGLDVAVEEGPRKFYVNYSLGKVFASLVVYKKLVVTYLVLDPGAVGPLPDIASSVAGKGHWGQGDLEVAISSPEDLETAKPLLRMAYREAKA